MTIFRGAALAAAAIALIGTAHAGAAGPTVTTTYTVGSGSVPGVDTGLVLQGQSVTVTAAGSVCPFGDGFCPGPAGYATWDTTSSSFGGFVLPGAPAWGLVGRVGSGPWMQVGTGPTVLGGTGLLVFAVNDDLFGDNSGSFTVTVSYACWPGWGYGDVNHDHCGPPGLVGKTAARTAGGRGNGQSHVPAGKANGRKADR